jgi:hypothetical protein
MSSSITVPDEMRARYSELYRARSAASSNKSWAEVADIEQKLVELVNALATVLYPQDELIGALALDAKHYWQQESAETRQLLVGQQATGGER